MIKILHLGLSQTSSKLLNTFYSQAHSEVEVQGDRVATSPAPMEIDEASRPSSQEKIPETAQVYVRQASEPPTEVIDISDIKLSECFSPNKFLSVMLYFILRFKKKERMLRIRLPSLLLTPRYLRHLEPQ